VDRVADPNFSIPDPESKRFPDPGSQEIPGSGTVSKNSGIFNPKISF
jgi:hypothetical protein